jgi:hypothetical protein
MSTKGTWSGPCILGMRQECVDRNLNWVLIGGAVADEKRAENFAIMVDLFIVSTVLLRFTELRRHPSTNLFLFSKVCWTACLPASYNQSIIPMFSDYGTRSHLSQTSRRSPVVGIYEEVTTVFTDTDILKTPLRDGFQASPPIVSAFQYDLVSRHDTALEDSSDLGATSSSVLQVCVPYPKNRLVAQPDRSSGIDPTLSLLQRDWLSVRLAVSIGTSEHSAWDYFVVNVTNSSFAGSPNDLPWGASFQDPYVVALPILATESPTLRVAALALSAS